MISIFNNRFMKFLKIYQSVHFLRRGASPAYFWNCVSGRSTLAICRNVWKGLARRQEKKHLSYVRGEQ